MKIIKTKRGCLFLAKSLRFVKKHKDIKKEKGSKTVFFDPFKNFLMLAALRVAKKIIISLPLFPASG
jgi:hypothetical protein